MLHVTQLIGLGASQKLIEQTPAVRGVATSSSSSASPAPINTPAANKGDILFVFITTNGTPPTPPAGWHTLLSTPAESVFWRPVGVNQSATTESFTGVNASWSAICWALSGCDITQAPSGSGAGGSSANPNPPSRTAPWGQATNLWLTVWRTSGFAARTTSAYPANYTLGQATVAGLSGSPGIFYAAGACRVLNAETEDPGTATMSSTASWIAESWVLKPNTL